MPLSDFQKRKLARMIAVLDADGDGYVEIWDYTRRVEAVARHYGWHKDGPEYARNRRFAMLSWDALAESADADGDGRVSREEFLRWADAFLDDREAVRAYARGDIQLLFDAMDTDGDGRISEEEYRTYLEICGVDTSCAREFFAYADLDENGRIGRDEMSHAFEEFLLSTNPKAAGNYLFGPLE